MAIMKKSPIYMIVAITACLSMVICAEERNRPLSIIKKMRECGSREEYVKYKGGLLDFCEKEGVPEIDELKNGDAFQVVILQIVKEEMANQNMFQEYKIYENRGMIRFAKHPLPINPEFRYNTLYWSVSLFLGKYSDSKKDSYTPANSSASFYSVIDALIKFSKKYDNGYQSRPCLELLATLKHHNEFQCFPTKYKPALDFLIDIFNSTDSFILRKFVLEAISGHNDKVDGHWGKKYYDLVSKAIKKASEEDDLASVWYFSDFYSHAFGNDGNSLALKAILDNQIGKYKRLYGDYKSSEEKNEIEKAEMMRRKIINVGFKVIFKIIDRIEKGGDTEFIPILSLLSAGALKKNASVDDVRVWSGSKFHEMTYYPYEMEKSAISFKNKSN
jgi:hypothetical protein